MDIVGYLFIDKEGNRKMITSSNEKLLTKDRTGKIGDSAELDFEVWKDIVSQMEIVKDENVVYKENKYEDFLTLLKKSKTLDELKNAYEEISTNRALITNEEFSELVKVKNELKAKISK